MKCIYNQIDDIAKRLYYKVVVEQSSELSKNYVYTYSRFIPDKYEVNVDFTFIAVDIIIEDDFGFKKYQYNFTDQAFLQVLQEK
jgi:hypothetical protein